MKFVQDCYTDSSTENFYPITEEPTKRRVIILAVYIIYI